MAKSRFLFSFRTTIYFLILLKIRIAKMSETQLQLPIIVPLARLPIPTRYDEFERGLLASIKAQSGLSKGEIIRRCVRVLRAEVALHGDCSFLTLPATNAFRASGRQIAEGRAGRKPKLIRIKELERAVIYTLREAERMRAQLKELKAA